MRRSSNTPWMMYALIQTRRTKTNLSFPLRCIIVIAPPRSTRPSLLLQSFCILLIWLLGMHKRTDTACFCSAAGQALCQTIHHCNHIVLRKRERDTKREGEIRFQLRLVFDGLKWGRARCRFTVKSCPPEWTLSLLCLECNIGPSSIRQMMHRLRFRPWRTASL